MHFMNARNEHSSIVQADGPVTARWVPGAPSRDAAEENNAWVVSGSRAAAAASAIADASFGANTALQLHHHND